MEDLKALTVCVCRLASVRILCARKQCTVRKRQLNCVSINHEFTRATSLVFSWVKRSVLSAIFRSQNADCVSSPIFPSLPPSTYSIFNVVNVTTHYTTQTTPLDGGTQRSHRKQKPSEYLLSTHKYTHHRTPEPI